MAKKYEKKSELLNGEAAVHVAPMSDELASKPAFALSAQEMFDQIKQIVRSAVSEGSLAAPVDARDWLTVAQACEVLGKSDRWLLQQLRTGAIEGRKVGNAWRVSREEIERVQRKGLREV